MLAAIETAGGETPSSWRVSERKGASWLVSVASLGGSLYRVGIEAETHSRDAAPQKTQDAPNQERKLDVQEWELDVVLSQAGMVSVIRDGLHCEAAIDSAIRKGVRYVEVAIPDRRMRLVVEEPESVGPGARKA